VFAILFVLTRLAIFYNSVVIFILFIRTTQDLLHGLLLFYLPIGLAF